MALDDIGWRWVLQSHTASWLATLGSDGHGMAPLCTARWRCALLCTVVHCWVALCVVSTVVHCWVHNALLHVARTTLLAASLSAMKNLLLFVMLGLSGINVFKRLFEICDTIPFFGMSLALAC